MSYIKIIKNLEKSKKYPLSDLDISRYLCEPLHIASYKELASVSSIYELFHQDYFVLLYQISDKMGHWVVCLNRPDHIEFFDSLGKCPDITPNYADQTVSKKNLQTSKLLTRLLYESGKPVIYNNIPLQSKGSNTCGRWVLARINMRDIPLEDFQLFFANPYFTPDQMVTMMIRIQRA